MRRSTLESRGGGMLTSRVLKVMFVSARPGGAHQPSQDPEISRMDNADGDGHNITTSTATLTRYRGGHDH